MTIIVKPAEPDSLPTRPSLLGKLQGPDDPQSWQEFYRLYGPLIRNFALKAGCTDTEADEVLQETAIAVARHLPGYHYDPEVCRFKTWLLNQTAWRVKDQLKKRQRWDERVHKSGGGSLAGAGESLVQPGDDPARTATVERVADPRAQELDALWDAEWRSSLLKAASDRVRAKVNTKQWQAFDLNVLKEWPAGDVAKSLGITLASVYLAKHRVAAAVKKEMAKLEREMEDIETLKR